MGSFTDLNTYSQTEIEYTDQRNPRPVFNTPAPSDLDFTATATSFTILRDLTVLEFIRPEALNFQFQVDVSGLSGSSVDFGTLPAGLTVSTVDGVYTVSGITTVAQWDQIKDPVITIPDTFQGSFFYAVNFVWQDSTGTNTLSYDVGTYVPVAKLESTTALTANAKLFKGLSANLDTQMSLSLVFKQVALVSFFNLTGQSTKLKRTSAILSTNTSINVFSPFAVESSRTYLSNVSNQIFASDTPFIQDKNPATTANFELTFITDQNSKINRTPTDNAVNSLTYSGTLTEINSAIDDLNLYPDYAYTGQIQLQWQLQKDNVLIDTGIIYFAHAGQGTLETTTYTFNNSTSFTIPYEEAEYGKWEYLVVAGGGGGSAGGGGGGGQVLKGTNQILSHNNNPFAITVGGGGSRGNYSFNWVTGGGWTNNGGTGGNSSALGLTAFGGLGGRSSSNSDYTVWNFNGGDTRTTANLTSSGGAGAPTPSGSLKSDFMIGAGGGGAGAGQAGSAAPFRGFNDGDPDEPIYDGGNGGNGVTSSITGVSIYYGGGGGGGPGYQGLGNDEGLGGLGGGGNASNNTQNTFAENGVDTLGGGGGGGSNDYVFGPDSWKAPGRGGKGVVILKVTPK